MTDFTTGDGEQGKTLALTDEAVQEFFRERQERIAVRRARIGERILRFS